ncbi:MAG: DUF3391 domain-containing protein [Pseudohongiellaceae bacterium]
MAMLLTMNHRPEPASPDSQIKIACSDLLQGMFVSELDRPWKDTPFPFEGFHIRTAAELETLRLFCKYVFIDTNRGTAPKLSRERQLTILTHARDNAPPVTPLQVRHGVYKTKRPIKQEIDTASRLVAEATTAFNLVLEKAREGNPLQLKKLAPVLNEILESIVRNPDALVWQLNTTREKPGSFMHCLRATIWALVLARHVGLAKEDMRTLALGTILADIGMVRLPSGFVSRRGPFARREYLLYRKHIALGLELLRPEKLDSKILNIVRAHHERHDGRGFPRRVKGNQIPMLARFAALAYRYDRLLHSSQQNGISPATAVGRLYKQRNLHFTEQLVYEFIQAVGMYPTGSIIELTSGEMALVLEQNPSEKLLPKIAVITDSGKNVLKKPLVISLRDEVNEPSHRTILKSVGTGGYYIDPANLGDHIFGKRVGLGRLGIRMPI